MITRTTNKSVGLNLVGLRACCRMVEDKIQEHDLETLNSGHLEH